MEVAINSRPLTYVFDNSDGISYPLTPSQLINGRNLEMLPNDRHSEILSTYETLSTRGRFHRKPLTQLSRRWQNEYLLILQTNARLQRANYGNRRNRGCEKQA